MSAPLRRKALAATSAALTVRRATPAGVYAKLKGKEHLHACTDLSCLKVYLDNCHFPAINGRCLDCRGLYRLIWEVARDPQPCCLDNTVQIVSADELQRYDLAGPGPWFQCRTCARCHPRPCVSPTPKGQS